jgi:BolA protein
MTVARLIRESLTTGLAPDLIEIEDQSARHAGHGGHAGDGESHFALRIVAAAFEGRSRIERHRMVHALLDSLVGGRVHALALATLTPAEAGREPARP